MLPEVRVHWWYDYKYRQSVHSMRSQIYYDYFFFKNQKFYFGWYTVFSLFRDTTIGHK